MISGVKLKKISLILCTMILGAWIGGCQVQEGSHLANDTGKTSALSDVETGVLPYQGEKSQVISSVYTERKELSLVFTGMGNKETMDELLDQLDQYGLEVTFFLPGMRVAEEPDIAKEILRRGHRIENNTLTQEEVTELSYEEVYDEIHLSSEVIKKETGVSTQYVASKSGKYNDDTLMASAHTGHKAFISYSLNLRIQHMQTAEMIESYIRKNMNRGGIIALSTEGDTALIESIPLIVEAADQVGYDLINLDELIAHREEKKPLEEIPGYDAAKINPHYEEAQYQLITRGQAGKKQISLTFDDWGTDFTITKILDVLDEYQVKATFFLRTNGVENNPNLAKAIADRGHEIANHTYSHPVITTITAEELQEEVVRAHRILTEAIQKQPSMLFRPPTGVVDEETAKAVAATGYHTIVMYDVISFDWDADKKADDIIQTILEETTDGSIILLHLLDGISTPEALPHIIEGLIQRGYRFTTVGDMIGL